MIKLEHTEVVGFRPALRGMRNPKNSWHLADSKKCSALTCKDEESCESKYSYCIGEKDHDLAMRLAKGGPVHAKYRRMIDVYVDITAPLYWWKEFDTYKVGTVANSCSTMHKLTHKEFELGDFSHEHLITGSIIGLEETIEYLNEIRDWYLKWDYMSEEDRGNFDQNINDKKDLWWQMIQHLPTSYNQKRTVKLNYEVLANIYKWRKNHKLDEWREFCKWIENLPYSEIITQEVEDESSKIREIQVEAYKTFHAILKRRLCAYDLEPYHSFDAVEGHVIDEVLDELLAMVEVGE